MPDDSKTVSAAPAAASSELPAAPRAPIIAVGAQPSEGCTSPGLGAPVPSLEPGDQVCDPVLRERDRRKAEDTDIRAALTLIQNSVATNHKLTRKAAGALILMVIMAALEYAGVIGGGKAPIWAKAVVDALLPAATAESK